MTGFRRLWDVQFVRADNSGKFRRRVDEQMAISATHQTWYKVLSNNTRACPPQETTRTQCVCHTKQSVNDKCFQFHKVDLTQGFPQGCPQNRCEIFRFGPETLCSMFSTFTSTCIRNNAKTKQYFHHSPLAHNDKWKTKWNNTEKILIYTGIYTMRANYCIS